MKIFSIAVAVSYLAFFGSLIWWLAPPHYVIISGGIFSGLLIGYRIGEMED
jgi:hypothetical protein